MKAMLDKKIPDKTVSKSPVIKINKFHNQSIIQMQSFKEIYT